MSILIPALLADTQVLYIGPSESLQVSQIADFSDKNDISHYIAGNYSQIELSILSDVQDRIDTVEQRGLYVLLESLKRGSQVHKNQNTEANEIGPQALIDDPGKYRGMWFKYKVLLDKEVKSITPARPNLYDGSLYYITAKIPFGDRLAMPAVILLLDKPVRIPMRAELNGIFYMILRAQTQQIAPLNHTGQLDYLVFVTGELIPSAAAALKIDETDGYKSLWISGGALLVLALVWVVLRQKVGRQSIYRHKRFLGKNRFL